MADPQTSTRGRGAAVAIASASVRVPASRLSRIFRMYALVHGRSPIPAPARCTTASAPSSDALSTHPSAGDQRASSGLDGSRRISRTTSWPSARSDRTNAEPMRPDEPVTVTLMTPA